MEFKVIIYIIIGVLYFLYTIGKKVEGKKKESSSSGDMPPVSKPVSPPASNPMEDILREIKRKQAEMEGQKKLSVPQPKPVKTYQQKKPQKEILLRETKKATVFEGTSDYDPVYQRELTEEEKIHDKEILLRGTKKATVFEGTSNYEPLYQREVTAEEKIHSKEIRLKNEGTYKVQTGEEAQVESDADRDYVYELDARQAFIGSVIFERKY